MTMKIDPSDLPIGPAQGQTAPDELHDQSVVQGAPDSAPPLTHVDQIGASRPESSRVANPTEVALAEIASRTNLSNPSEVETALRESAHLLIEYQLADKRDSPEMREMIELLSDQIVQDPQLRTRFLRILSNIKSA